MAEGLLRELNPGPLAPEARIMPLYQEAANDDNCLDRDLNAVRRGGAAGQAASD